jgi:prepilin-type N-terminal cleavage/methylation domain-containing protein
MRITNRKEQGFTLIESLVVISVMLILSGMVMFHSFGTIESYRANSALDTVASQLRVARQVAISQRRPVLIKFVLNPTPPAQQSISYQMIETASTDVEAVNTGANGLIYSASLPSQTQYLLEPGVPDTPMAFGMCGPACIAGANGGPPNMYFSPTGQFSSDEAGLFPINGTIFLGIQNHPETARAVTILGSTGRVRPYTYVGGITGWME